jgi:tRNA A37 N6-isopentenylltransferase MiaA
MIEEWNTKEIQYAKRQYTFMKKNPNIEWKEIT